MLMDIISTLQFTDDTMTFGMIVGYTNTLVLIGQNVILEV